MPLEDTIDGYMDREEIPTLLGFDVRGDEARQGPIYNHARLFTWSQSTRIIIHGFKSTLDKIRNYQDCQGIHWDPRVRSEVCSCPMYFLLLCHPGILQEEANLTR